MTTDEKRAVSMVLNQLSFVRWDRFTEDDGQLMVYGWIKKHMSSRMDFIVVSFDMQVGEAGHTLSYGWTTSSSERSAEIGRLFGADPEGHLVCKRVENELPEVVNAVLL